MHAIAMVHKMQRLALSSSNSMDIDDKKCSTISEEVDEGWGFESVSFFRAESVCSYMFCIGVVLNGFQF
jgi:hypothetical protein